ncbi:MAG TPA: MJ0042-type zinc finger domain-containing protein [Planctomycetaceae bacterium]|jgi:predicted Zn finger-like uncharacterized protein|nr:MJ0042-type zinc finger domain-containing protein [Planctomycetaceae bacterium]
MGLPISLTCPKCDSKLKIKDESLLGSRVKCPKCGARFTADEPLEVLDEFEVVDEGFDDAGELRPLPKSRHRPRPAKQESRANTFLPPTFLGSGDERRLKQRRLRIAVASGAGALVVCVIVGGILLVRGSERPARFEPPASYVPIHAGSLPLSGVIPIGWKESYGGGVGAVPMRASFSDGESISIEIRQTVGLSITIAQVVVGKPVQPPSLPQLHDHHRKMIKPDFSRFEDGSAQPIEAEGFPEACVSNFTASEPGIFGSDVKGCRVTLRSPARQFNVVCKCKPSQFDDVLPVFEKIVASLRTPEEEKKREFRRR